MSIADIYNPTNYRIETSASSSSNTKDRFEDLGVEDFLRLMVAELQNQDPLNPSDNKDMLNQLNSMRQIVSSDKLSSSMESIMLGQSVATASNLLGKTVKGTNQLGEETTGTVDRVVFEDGKPKVYIGLHALQLDSITEITDKPSDDGRQAADDMP